MTGFRYLITPRFFPYGLAYIVFVCFMLGLFIITGFDYSLNYYFIAFKSFFGDTCFSEPISFGWLAFFYSDIFLAEPDPTCFFTFYFVLILGVCLVIYLFPLISFEFIECDYWVFLGDGLTYFDTFGGDYFDIFGGDWSLLPFCFFIEGLGDEEILFSWFLVTYLLVDFWCYIGLLILSFERGNSSLT